MIGVERQVRNSGIFLMPMVVGALLPLITLPVFTRILTAEDFGAWALANVYAAFASGIANFGLVVSYERNFFEYTSHDERSALLYSTVAFVVAALAVLALVTWTFREHLALAVAGSPVYGGLFFWAFCSMGVASIKAYFLMYFRNTHAATSYVRYTMGESVLYALFSLFLVAYLRVGVVGLVVGQLLASGVVLTLLVYYFAKRLPVAFSGRLLTESLKLSYPLTPRLLLKVVGTHFDKFMIGMLGSVGDVGVYTIGQKVAYLIFGFMTALENVFAPQVYKRMFARAVGGTDEVGAYLTPFAYVSAGGGLLLALFGEEAVTLLTPISYHGAVIVAGILVIHYTIMFFGKQPQLLFAKKTYLISALSVVSVVVNAGLVTVGTMLWGTVGAACGILAGGVVTISMFQIMGQRHYRIDWQYARLAAIFGLFAASTVLVLLLRATNVDYVHRLFVKMTLLLLYLGMGMRLRIITRDSLATLRGAFFKSPIPVE